MSASQALAADSALADTEAADGAPGGPQIIVTGHRDSDDVVSAKSTRPLIDTPQTITVVSAQTLRKQKLLSLRDALSTLPGITFGAGEGGGGYGDKINLRGYTADNDITQDGVRDSAQYSRTDPFNLQQIEVYNGANSVYNGSGSVGGTINLVSKVPLPEDLTIAQASVGTDSYYRATIDSNVRVSDFVAVRLNAMYHENDVPGRDVEAYQRWGVAPAVTLGVGGPTSLTLAYVHQEDDNKPIFGVPYYAAVGGPIPGIDDSDYFGIVNLDRQRTKLDRLTATFDHAFSDKLSIRNLTRWQRVAQPTVTSAPQGDYCLAGGVLPTGAACAAGQQPGFYYPRGPRGLVREQVNDLLYNQTDLRADFTTGGLAHSLVIGVSAAQEDYSLTQAQLLRNPGGALPDPVQPPIDWANPDTVWRGPVNRLLTGKSRGHSTNIAGYVFDTVKLSDTFELNGGLRYERNEGRFRADSYATPAAGGGITASVPSRSEETLFSYRAGLVFKPVQAVSLYAAYANARTPSIASVRLGCTSGSGATFVNFCDVAPERAKSYEIGAKAEVGHMLLTAALFRNERSNFRVPANDPSIPDPQVLDGRARVDGIALGASGNITKNWVVFANYTYLDSKVLQSVSDACLAAPSAACGNSATVLDPQRGNSLQQTPRHSGSLFTSYSFPFGLQLGYGLTYQGSFALNQSTLAAPEQFRSKDWLTHRLFASYAVTKGLTAQVNVQNVTNERYFTGIRNNGWAMPGEERSAVFSLYYSF